MRGALIGVGAALRRAREHLAVSVEEVSRDTRIRAEFLYALEEEDFGSLPGDVYVRGSLRTYASYVGLDPERVMAAYEELFPQDRSAPAGPTGPVADPVMTQRQARYGLAILAAVTAIAAAAALGILSRSHSAPSPADLPQSPVPIEVGGSIRLALVGHLPVRYEISTDGVVRRGTLEPGEQVTFEASEEMVARLSRGGAAEVFVNGVDLGRPGSRRQPWERTFRFGEQEATRSPVG